MPTRTQAAHPHPEASLVLASAPMPDEPENLAPMFNSHLDGWNRTMGVRFVRVVVGEVILEVTIGPQHLQPYGIVHGGVYSGLIETATSVGAALSAMSSGHSIVGLENSTSFLHATREGTLRVVARPAARGKRAPVWEATVTNDKGEAVATGRVRLLRLDPDTQLAGETVQPKG